MKRKLIARAGGRVRVWAGGVNKHCRALRVTERGDIAYSGFTAHVKIAHDTTHGPDSLRSTPNLHRRWPFLSLSKLRYYIINSSRVLGMYTQIIVSSVCYTRSPPHPSRIHPARCLPESVISL